LLAHYSELGLVCEFGPQDTLQEKLDVPAQEKLDVPAAHISEQLATWLKGCECYLAVRRNGLSGDPPLSWLKNEPSRLALLGSKKQSTKDREMSLWQIAPGASP
jgi:hypothetical protein